MAFQGFSSQLRLAKLLANANRQSPMLSQEQKDRKKRLDRERTDKRLAENLAQRALVESRRA